MRILEKVDDSGFPFDWVDLSSWPDSKGSRVEIYLKNPQMDLTEGLIDMFFNLFGSEQNEILVYCKNCWDFCLDTWDINKDEHNYQSPHLSAITNKYLDTLSSSLIEQDYIGSCSINAWHHYLKITNDCIVNHIAPYGQIFSHERLQFFFYFHHTGSIGLYYKKENSFIKSLLSKAESEYDVVRYDKEDQ